MRLIVSLAENRLELAQAAAAGGADAIKVHLNVTHDASGAHFGGWADERAAITSIISAVDVPVGVMPGAEELPSPEDFADMAASGVRFIDLFAHHWPLHLLGRWSVFELIVAINRVLPERELFHLTSLIREGSNRISMLEASVISQEDYGKPLTFGDIATYRALADASQVPLLIPTQKLIQTEDLHMLDFEGIGGIMLGVIVTGRSPGSIEKVTRDFRLAIEDIIKD